MRCVAGRLSTDHLAAGRGRDRLREGAPSNGGAIEPIE
jgi:hypothetical protein